MKTAIQELTDYLHEQFPATIGHLPLTEKIRNVWDDGYEIGVEMQKLKPDTMKKIKAIIHSNKTRKTP